MIIKKEGILSLYKGLSAKIMIVVPAYGTTMSLTEFLRPKFITHMHWVVHNFKLNNVKFIICCKK